MLDAGVDHVSAYALIVEDGTRLAARMRRGELPYPDDDVAADRYLAADDDAERGRVRLVRGVQLGRARRPRAAGTTCSTGPAATGGGSGPGAHSHVGGVRWWNVQAPDGVRGPAGRGGLARRRAGRCSPRAERYAEDVMLRLRLADGLPLAHLDPAGRAAARRALADGLLAPGGRTRPGGPC